MTQCNYCGKDICRPLSKTHIDRNENSYCNRTCYLSHVRREKFGNIDYFDDIDSHEKAYWLGFIYADGNVGRNNNSITLVSQKSDYDHLLKFSKIFTANVVFDKSDNEGSGTARCSLSSLNMRKSLIKHGVIPNKTHNDLSCSIMTDLNPEFINTFILGLFDGDGCISSSNTVSTNYTFSICGNHNLMRSILDHFCKELGLSKTKIEDRGQISVIRWSGRRQIEKIYKYLYSDSNVFLERKKSIFKEIIDSDPYKSKSSIYRGVTWHKNNKKWLASISHNKKRISLGYYENEIDAASAYDSAIIKYNKPRVKMNFLKR